MRAEIERRSHGVFERGKYIMGLEVGELTDHVGVRYAIGVASGTDALLTVLRGAKSVFVDIDPDTYNIDRPQIEVATTDGTPAVMPVSLYGEPVEFDEINAIAEKHGLQMIEDGAQSFVVTHKGKKSCSLATMGATSFFSSTPLGGYGDSVACFTDDELTKRIRDIRVHGQDRRKYHPLPGVNGRTDTFQAAFPLPRLDIFPEEANLRQHTGECYSEAL